MGVGKTVMGLQYIAEGARRGERSLLLSLDEQVPQLLRNAASIGLDLQKEVDRGIIRMYYDSPQEIDVDYHFYTIERIVEEFKPKRVLIDSLSTYGRSLGTNGRLSVISSLRWSRDEGDQIRPSKTRESGDARLSR